MSCLPDSKGPLPLALLHVDNRMLISSTPEKHLQERKASPTSRTLTTFNEIISWQEPNTPPLLLKRWNLFDILQLLLKPWGFLGSHAVYGYVDSRVCYHVNSFDMFVIYFSIAVTALETALIS